MQRNTPPKLTSSPKTSALHSMRLVMFLPSHGTYFLVLLLGHLGFCSKARWRASFTAVQRLVCFVALSDATVPALLPAAAAAAENAR